MTSVQVQQARDSGYDAGSSGGGADNPYYYHVPVWELLRMSPAQRAEYRNKRDALLPLSQAWRAGYSNGLQAAATR